MLNFWIAFDSPWYLALLGLLPILWWSGRRTLSGLGRMRRWTALTLRSLVFILIVLALAEAQFVRRSDRLTVIYLLDQSLSVPEAQRRAWIGYVNQAIQAHRDQDRQDRVGVIVFGRDAAVEIPPIDETVPVNMAIESLLDQEYTDLAGAMKMAMALFPHDSAKRVVIVSDGNENLGDGLGQAQALADAGVSIDVAPIALQARGEVAVEKVAISSDVRRGQPFDVRVVLNNTTPEGANQREIKGKLKLMRRSGEREETLAEQPITLPPGKKVLTIREEINQADFYTYEARFTPDDPADDALPQNNRATSFTHVRGRGHVLLIEDWANPGQFDVLVERLQEQNLEVTLRTSEQLFSSLSELQRFDTVVLADVPRSSGDDNVAKVTNFSDEQIEMLVRNTQQMGSGLVMIGGPNSFGAGGWTNTELEKAMPVDFQVKSAKVAPVGALAMVMHASEMPEGNYWQKVIGQEAIKALGDQDYCGLIHWEGNEQWLWSRAQGGIVKVGPNRKTMLSRLDRMTPGDMPAFDPAMIMVANSFAALRDAAVKHMIMISDGDPAPPSNSTIGMFKKLGVKITTVAVGTHGPAGSTPLQDIARATGGKYYVVTSAKALPRIYQREARRVARPLVYENKNGLTPRVKFQHEMIKGLDTQIPPITGFVLTTIKDSPLVEVSLVSPKPEGEENATVLASWTYGLGKTVALTTDAGKRWATSWTGWDNYDKLFSQIVRWSMRPVADAGKFTVAGDVQDGQGRVVITALSKDDEFLNYLSMTGTVVGPNFKPIDMTVRQTAPGRYVGEFDAKDAGSYFVIVNPGPEHAPLRTGLNVSYSDEFRDRETNQELLKTIASLAPRGGESGLVIADATGRNAMKQLLEFNSFRRDLPRSSSGQDIWHLLVLAGSCLFFFDVFNRRVNVSLAWVPPLAAKVRDKVLRRQSAPAPTETMNRLRSRKAAMDDQLEQRRAATRFEANPEAPVDTSVLDQQQSAAQEQQRPRQPTRQDMTPQQEQDSYTERLLKAKKKVWEDKNS